MRQKQPDQLGVLVNWDCTINLSCFHLPHRAVRFLKKMHIYTVSDLLAVLESHYPPRPNQSKKGTSRMLKKHAAIISLYHMVRSRLVQTIEYTAPIKQRRRKLLIEKTFLRLVPLMKKHKLEQALVALPKSISKNIKLYALPTA